MDRPVASHAPWGLGTLRLHEAADPRRLVHEALDRGCRLLDLADVYGDGTVGHAEQVAAAALASWAGPRDLVRVVTKGGLVRRGRGRWDTKGTASHLRAAAQGSLARLGRIDLYLLHAPDPRTSFATSVRALDRLREEGLVRAVGLCNVRVCDIEAALQITPVAAVQIAMSPWDREPVDGGVVRFCRARGIELLAHSPFGGARSHARMTRAPELAVVARGASPYWVAVEWYASHGVTPLVGATRLQTLPEPAALDEGQLRALDEVFPGGALRTPRPQGPDPEASDGEVVLLMGIPGAGKSTAVQGFLDRGYARLNRDERGGRLDDLLAPLERGLTRG